VKRYLAPPFLNKTKIFGSTFSKGGKGGKGGKKLK